VRKIIVLFLCLFELIIVLFLFAFIGRSLMANYTAEQYISDVKTGRVAACKWTRLAVERHLSDLKRAGKKGFPYHFDPEPAKRAIDFIQLDFTPLSTQD